MTTDPASEVHRGTDDAQGAADPPACIPSKHSGRTLGWILLVLLSLLTLYRLTLLDRGALAWPDEGRYIESLVAVEKLSRGNLKGFCWSVASTEGRPGDGLLRVVPAAFQYVWSKSGGPPSFAPESLRIATLVNVAVSLGVVFLVYRIGLIALENHPGLALTGAALFSLTANAHLYVRHVLPYDAALLIGLGAVAVALRAQAASPRLISRRAYLGVGSLTGLSFVVYPGYFPLAAAAMASVVWEGPNRRALALAGGRLSWCLAGAAVPIAAFEIMARIGATSYLGTLRRLSGTITQGSFSEGFSFPIEYLLRIEGVTGLALLILLVWFMVTRLHAASAEAPRPGRRLEPAWVVLGAMFVLYSASGALFHKSVWYGRLLHLYYPFVVLAGMAGIAALHSPRVRAGVCAVTLAAALFSFCRFAVEYSALAYPRDVLARFGIAEPERYALSWESPGPHADLLEARAPAGRDTRTLLVNPAHIYPVPEAFKRYEPPVGATVLYRQLHFLGFAAYGFEGYSIQERARLRDREYQVGIYRLPPEKAPAEGGPP